MLTAYDTKLNDFCRTFLIEGQDPPLEQAAQFSARYAEVQNTLFEQLMLFDRLSVKVWGENIPLTVILENMGLKAFEELAEQRAISFDQWNVSVFYLTNPIAGVNPLASGRMSSDQHTNPETSADLGLNWWKNAPIGRQRRKLVQKVADLYSQPDPDLAEQAVRQAYLAFDAGRFAPLDLVPDGRGLDQMTPGDRAKLTSCADEYAQYMHVVKRGLTSYSDYPKYALFSDAVDRTTKAGPVAEGFARLRVIEEIPDLGQLRSQLPNAFRDVTRLRGKRPSRTFRNWLATTTSTEGGRDVVSAYVDAIANRKGWFDSVGAKITKSVAMAGIGTALGFVAGGPVGAVVGGTAAKVAEPFVTELGLDLVDNLILDGAAKGWSPRMFFDDLRRLKLDTTSG